MNKNKNEFPHERQTYTSFRDQKTQFSENLPINGQNILMISQHVKEINPMYLKTKMTKIQIIHFNRKRNILMRHQ